MERLRVSERTNDIACLHCCQAKLLCFKIGFKLMARNRNVLSCKVFRRRNILVGNSWKRIKALNIWQTCSTVGHQTLWLYNICADQYIERLRREQHFLQTKGRRCIYRINNIRVFTDRNSGSYLNVFSIYSDNKPLRGIFCKSKCNLDDTLIVIETNKHKRPHTYSKYSLTVCNYSSMGKMVDLQTEFRQYI